MKRIVALLLLVVAANVRAISTSHSLFSLGLAAAAQEKDQLGGRFKDDSYKATLAAQWDLLPAGTSAQQEAKAQGRQNYFNVFSVYPDDIDLTQMSHYISLAELCKQTQEKLGGQLSDLQRQHAALQKNYKKVSGESATNKESLSQLSVALNDYSRNFKNLFKALDASQYAHTESAGNLTSQELTTLKTSLAGAQNAYNQSLENLHDKAADFNLDVKLTNNYLNLIIKGELSKYASTGTEAPEEQPQVEGFRGAPTPVENETK